MARDPYSALLGSAALSTAGSFGDIFLVPAARRYVVMSLYVHNGAAALAVRWRLSLTNPSSGHFFGMVTPADDGELVSDARLVVTENRALRLHLFTTPAGGNTLRVTAFGYDLTGA